MCAELDSLNRVGQYMSEARLQHSRLTSLTPPSFPLHFHFYARVVALTKLLDGSLSSRASAAVGAAAGLDKISEPPACHTLSATSMGNLYCKHVQAASFCM
jgi:hypothetical protein